MVTHGDGGSFWAVAKKGAEDGAKQMGVDAEVLRVQQRPAEAGAADRRRRDREGRRPRRLGAEPGRAQGLAPEGRRRRHPGHHAELGRGRLRGARRDTPTSARPRRSPARARARSSRRPGAKKLLCVIHEQANIGLNQRCDGAKKGFGGDVENLQVKGTDDIQTTLTEIQSKLQSDKSIDAVLALNPDIAVAARDAVKGAGSERQARHVRPQRRRRQGDPGRRDRVRGRPAAVPAGLPAGGVPDAQQDQREHRRRRPARAHRPGLRHQGQRRDRREARGGRHRDDRGHRRRQPGCRRHGRRSTRPGAGGGRAPGQHRPRGAADAPPRARRAARRARHLRCSSGSRPTSSARSAGSRTGPTSPRRSGSWPSPSRC